MDIFSIFSVVVNNMKKTLQASNLQYLVQTDFRALTSTSQALSLSIHTREQLTLPFINHVGPSETSRLRLTVGV